MSVNSGGGQRIFIDNRNNQFASARDAFNSVIGSVSGETVIFLHQDIRFLQDNVLENILNYVWKLDRYGVVGVAGCPNAPTWKIFTNIVHGAKRVSVGEKINEMTEVQTVDECFFVMCRKELQKLRFNNISGWHMYAVEQCLRSIQDGLKNYVVPADGLWHVSDGKSLGPEYMDTLDEMIKRYGEDFDYFNTTIKFWKTHGINAYIYRHYYKIKQILKRAILK